MHQISSTSIQSMCRRRSSFEFVEGVYIVPNILSFLDIQHALCAIRPPGLLGFCGPGRDEEGHSFDSTYPSRTRIDDKEEPSRKIPPRKKSEPEINPCDPHGRPFKPHVLPDTAAKIEETVLNIDIGIDVPFRVDINMKIYRLTTKSGIVAPHTDDDFCDDEGNIARWSILVHLEGDYMGGETIFQHTKVAPRLNHGDCLLFRHDILHEGKALISGTKYILKTDLFCR